MSSIVRNISKKGIKFRNSLSFESPYQLEMGTALSIHYLSLLIRTFIKLIALGIIIDNDWRWQIITHYSNGFYITPFKINTIIFIQSPRNTSSWINHIQNRIRIWFFSSCKHDDIIATAHKFQEDVQKGSLIYIETDILVILQLYNNRNI